jgi:DNA-binding LacI/PurR family transcriptional regulator
MTGHPPADFGISGVDCDNYKGAVMATDHLLAVGRRRIAHISGNLETPCGLDRRNGYRDALAAGGVPCDTTWEALGDFHLKPARQATERLLKNHPDLDAVFVASDEMAVVVMDVLTRAGRRIPDDVAVIGFDDSPCAARASLSTVRQSIGQTGRAAVEMLMAQIADPAARPKLLVLDVELIVRESTTTGSGGPVTDG